MTPANTFPFSDMALSRRLEDAEGYACVQYTEARRRLYPESGAEWMRCAGAYVAFDGISSPVTQTFGLGVFEEATVPALETIEQFFVDRGAPVFHEVSPFAGVPTLSLLSQRGYRPIEISSVMYRPIDEPSATLPDKVSVRVISADEADLWREVSARGWSHEYPQLREFLLDLGRISAARNDSFCFLAELDEEPGAAGVLSIHEGVALFAGSATVPELRRRGLQGALLHERMRYAHEHGCDLAMMVALPGSDSQRNAERKGFRIAYTRTKWHLYHRQRSE